MLSLAVLILNRINKPLFPTLFIPSVVYSLYDRGIDAFTAGTLLSFWASALHRLHFHMMCYPAKCLMSYWSLLFFELHDTNTKHHYFPDILIPTVCTIPLREVWARCSCLRLGWWSTDSRQLCRESQRYGSGRAASTPSRRPPREAFHSEGDETEPGHIPLLPAPLEFWVEDEQVDVWGKSSIHNCGNFTKNKKEEMKPGRVCCAW